jgi:diaminohydroxyphosphoribosylaminopyrimidine deaminase/5-amino-6-(5-phosphoribosylamino)uracil reductase
MKAADETYMKMALTLAEKGIGRTSPNPAVGAVIVKNGEVIASDYHRRSGTPHAEVLAIKKAGMRARGATLFVTLEPCCHTDKKTPPCTGAIIRAGIRKVVIAMIDPNPKVTGRGILELRRAGISTKTGIMEEAALKLNESFITFITAGRPFIILKIAQSLDGKIATSRGESKWITGAEARMYVHKLRRNVDAVLVGVGTVRKDNPSLDCRIRGGRDPFRVIVDSSLKIPVGSRVLRHRDGKTIIATTKKAPGEKIEQLRARGHAVLVLNDKAGRVDLKRLVKELGKRDIISLMIEGGSSINASALSQRIVDKIIFFYAPKIIGGVDAFPSVGGVSPTSLKKILRVRNVLSRKIGDDILIEGYL